MAKFRRLILHTSVAVKFFNPRYGRWHKALAVLALAFLQRSITSINSPGPKRLRARLTFRPDGEMKATITINPASTNR